LRVLPPEPTLHRANRRNLVPMPAIMRRTRLRCTEDAKVLEIMTVTTSAAAFCAAVAAHAGRPFLAVPASSDRGLSAAASRGRTARPGQRVEELAGLFRRAGYGFGHRVADACSRSRPRTCGAFTRLALNSILWLCACVPINPDYRCRRDRPI